VTYGEEYRYAAAEDPLGFPFVAGHTAEEDRRRRRREGVGFLAALAVLAAGICCGTGAFAVVDWVLS
jgi:hypothetical protein